MPERMQKQEQPLPWFGIHQDGIEPAGLSGRYLRVLHNMSTRNGMLHTRPGLTPMNGVQLGSSGKRTVYGMDIWKASSTEDRIIVACGDLLQYLPPTGGDPVTLTDSFPASGFTTTRTGAVTQFAHLGGLMFIVNGVDENVKYNGTNVTKMGVSAPTTLSAPSTAGGALTGVRKYRATHVSSTANGSHESEPTSITSVTYDAQQGTFSAPTVVGTDPQVDRWNLYATKMGGDEFYRVNTTPQTLATTITDNLSDTEVLASTPMDAVGTNALPPGKFQVLAAHQGRLVGAIADSNRLYYSEIGLDLGGIYPKPQSWPAGNYFTIPDSGGTKITAVVSFFEWIVVFQQYGIWSIKGVLSDSEDRTLSPTLVAPDYRGLGAASQGCVAVLDNRIVFAGKDNAYTIERNLSTLQTDLQVKPLASDISSLYQQVDFNQGAVSCADRDNSRWIFVGTGKAENN